MIEVSETQLSYMKHALGLDYENRPYRNRFFTDESDPNWNDLVGKGLAVKGTKHPNNDENVYFWLTKSGVEFIVGHKIRNKTYENL